MTSLASVEDHGGREADLLNSYGGFVDGIDIGPSPRWARRRAARLFCDQHPDLARWMTLPTPTRLRDLHRCKAWPFLS